MPTVLRKDILQDLPEGEVGGHLEEEKTQERLKERLYWAGHWCNVHDWYRMCTACARRRTPTPKQQEPRMHLKVVQKYGSRGTSPKGAVRYQHSWKNFCSGGPSMAIHTVVPCGQACKFLPPWKWPYLLLGLLLKVNYHVQHVYGITKSLSYILRG